MVDLVSVLCGDIPNAGWLHAKIASLVVIRKIIF